MRLPRRVPWVSLSELDEVCSWIYANQSDSDAQTAALNRLSAWRATTSLPLALESVHNLLAITLQDHKSSCSHLVLRQGYAAAIIRFVNGLVDPLQLGVYARSISSIANQLGMPSWLVELRHAATHEDLPSLELLRRGASECMQWLFENYFLPTLNPSSAPPSRGAPFRSVSPHLKQYKTLLKITTRDVSLKGRYGPSITAALRAIERWFAEAELAANISIAGLAGDGLRAADFDARERWVLDQFCDALMEKGALIPTSKRKRIPPKDAFLPPKPLVAIWEPLLVHVHSRHTTFPHVLVNQIISQLLCTTSHVEVTEISLDSGSTASQDVSYDICIARWALWCIRRWSKAGVDHDVDFRRRAVVDLITGLGPNATDIRPDQEAAFFLLRALTADDPHLEEARTTLLADYGSLSTAHGWTANDIVLMDDRLRKLTEEMVETAPVPNTLEDSMGNLGAPEIPTQVAPGWYQLQDWKAAPIGVCGNAT